MVPFEAYLSSAIDKKSYMNRRRLVVILGVLISAGLLWFAFRGLEPDLFWDSLGAADNRLLLGAMGIYALAVTVITLRWQFLLRAIQWVPMRQLIPLVTIGYMGNNIYPFRSGEILRVFLLRQDHNVPYARGATTVVVERVFDGVVMLTFVLVPLALLGSTPATARQFATILTPIFIVAVLVFFSLAARPGVLHRLATWGASLLPVALAERVRGLAADIVGGLEGLRSPADLAGAVVSSYVTWAIEAAVYWVVMIAFGIEAGYAVALLAVGAVNLAGLIPAAPGNLGVFEVVLSEVLVITAGVPNALAVACAVAIHIVIWLPPTLIGFVFLARRGLGLGAVVQASDLDIAAP